MTLLLQLLRTLPFFRLFGMSGRVPVSGATAAAAAAASNHDASSKTSQQQQQQQQLEDGSEPKDLHISEPELSLGLPCNEQRRTISMDLVYHEGYPKMEIRRWKLDGIDQRRRLDGVMVKFDEASRFFDIVSKMVVLNDKDKIVNVNET